MNLGIPGARHVTPARAAIAGGTAVVAAAAVTLSLTLTHGAAGTAQAGKPASARLSASSCTGPAGAAYIALPGYQAFDAVNSANCDLVQQYNVGDGQVPNTGTSDTSYDSSDEGVALANGTLYFANTGNDTLSVVPVADLTVANYANPTETLVPVGQDPEAVAVTPDGSQAWVADTGPQTGTPSLGAISVVSTATDKVTSTVSLPRTDPRAIAFSPSGSVAYVTTGAGLYVISTATVKVTGFVPGLGNPEGVAVSPDGKTVYVTNTAKNLVDVISAASNRVTTAIPVGQLPWQLAVSANGSTVYVADGDSNAVSVIDAASGKVRDTIADAGDPVSVALTPDGSELWVGGLTSGIVSVFDTSSDSLVGTFNVGYGGAANAGDGEEPTGIVLTTTPPPGS
jgi:YVTN family beta-propeller protein